MRVPSRANIRFGLKVLPWVIIPSALFVDGKPERLKHRQHVLKIASDCLDNEENGDGKEKKKLTSSEYQTLREAEAQLRNEHVRLQRQIAKTKETMNSEPGERKLGWFTFSSKESQKEI